MNVRNKILGPGQSLIQPPEYKTSGSGSGISHSETTPVVAAVENPQQSVPLNISESYHHNHQNPDLSFDLEPYTKVSPYQLGSVLYNSLPHSKRRNLRSEYTENIQQQQQWQQQHTSNNDRRRLIIKEKFLYLYVGSDNSDVKEAFCKYLEGKNLTFQIPGLEGHTIGLQV